MNECFDGPLENSDQLAYWNSENGKKWVVHQEGLDAITAVVKERLLARARLRNGEAIIDIGCGTGDTTMDAAVSVGPTGSVMGIDISAQLLKLAKKRAEASRLKHITYVLADAQTYNFEEGAADAVISRFGVMFFSDPVKAFTNIAHSLKRSGRIVFVAWASLDENPWFRVPRQVAIEHLGEPTPDDPNAPGPLAFQEIDYVTKILNTAGFTDVIAEAEDVPLPFFGSLKQTALLAASVGPAARIVRYFDGGEAEIATMAHAVERAFGEYADFSIPSVPSRLNFFSAIKS